MQNNAIPSRKAWLKDLKSQIIDLRNEGKEDTQIRKIICKEFSSYLSTTEFWIQKLFFLLLFIFVILGFHISYIVLMWGANLYDFNAILSPYISIFLFGLIGITLLFIFGIWISFFIDWFIFYKALDESLDEQFYLKLLRNFIILMLIGFVIFMILVFLVGIQISNLYGIPLEEIIKQALWEIFD